MGTQRATAMLEEPGSRASKRGWIAGVAAEGMTTADAPPLRPNAQVKPNCSA